MDNMRIVEAARSWIGTRFHHQGRVKKSESQDGGVDCLGLLVGVADELRLKLPDNRLLIEFDSTDYSHQPDTQRLILALSNVLDVVPKTDIRPGDIALLTIDNSPQHLAVLSNGSGQMNIIHAYAPARKVVEHALDKWWNERIAMVFRIRSAT